ncbi:MAG: hypothetical protein WC270_00065, partial [Patescibacteria group bacterium]
MFESITPQSNTQTPKAPLPPTTPLEIHTMPDRFLGGSNKSGKMGMGAPQPKGSSRKILIVVAVILVIALGAIAAVLFTDVLNRNSANTNNANLVVNNATANKNLNANSNLNANLNSNLNANTNTNLNSNVNTNTNANINSNLNANTNTNANTNASNPQAKNSVDTDKDSLTDAEEVVFGTNPSNQDSDGDGFIDGQEVKL